MRFYTNQHPFYCGIDLHARSMYICILSHDGEIVLPRNMKAAPETFLKAIAPLLPRKILPPTNSPFAASGSHCLNFKLCVESSPQS